MTPNEKTASPLSPLIKLAWELGPLLVFFIGATVFDFFVATAAFMVALFVSMAGSFLVTRHLPIMSIISAVIVAVFGGLTLYLHDETFFRMKPTIIYSLFGSVLLGGLLFKKPLLSAVLGTAIKLTEQGWRRLSLRWSLFFFALAAMNEIVRLYFPDQWITFKVFGTTGLTFAFALAQVTLIARHELPTDDPTEDMKAD